MTADAEAIQRVAVIGGGLIGQSWASLFAAHGLDAVVYDPDPAAADALRAFVDAAWPDLRALGLTALEAPRYPESVSRFDALGSVDFVQENGPDRIGIKREIVAALEAVIDETVVIASSTSSLLPSDIQADARAPGRILVGHPMNPPHIIPLVEIVGGRSTDDRAVAVADAFYRRLGREVVQVKREVVGHLANRLTAALFREAVHLVAEGVADVDSVDRAIAHGPGLRWALMGPHMTYHLGGGPGGIRHYMDHLGPTQEARWRELGDPSLTEPVKARVIDGVESMLAAEREAGRDPSTLAARRDAALVALQAIKRKNGF